MHDENFERLKLLALQDSGAATELIRIANRKNDFELIFDFAIQINHQDPFNLHFDLPAKVARELFYFAKDRDIIVSRWAAHFLRTDLTSKLLRDEFKKNDVSREKQYQEKFYPDQFLLDLNESDQRVIIERDLRWADFSEMDLRAGNFEMVNLSYANLSGTLFGEKERFKGFITPRHPDAVITGHLGIDAANLTRANLSGANLTRADLNKVKLCEANLVGAILTETKLHGADFRGANLSGVDLSSAEISAANFMHANLSGANLSGCGFSGSNFSYANLSKANLSNIRFDYVDFDGQNFSGISLRDVNLTGANLYLRNLKGRDLSHANLTDANLSKVKYDNLTKWPEGFIIPDDAIFDDG